MAFVPLGQVVVVPLVVQLLPDTETATVGGVKSVVQEAWAAETENKAIRIKNKGIKSLILDSRCLILIPGI